jgi:hypothetical protein
MKDSQSLEERVRNLEIFQAKIESANSTKETMIKKFLREAPRLFMYFVGACFVIYEIKKMDPHL